MRRLLVVGLGALLALVTLAAVAVCVLLWTDWGHARVAALASAEVSSAIAGELRIGHIDQVDLPFVHARDVQILAPDGVPAIAVERATIELDFDKIRRGVFAWHRAEIDGGIVRVLEDANGKINMEETFRSEPSASDGQKGDTSGDEAQNDRSKDVLDMRTMVTSGMTLIIGGKTLPELRLVDLHGIMSIHVPNEGPVMLRFDEYRGSIVKGLPTGRLDFHDVKGHVKTDSKRLLRFEGAGKSEGEPVAFELDIVGEPKKKVKIDATFQGPAAEAMSTRLVGAWTHLKGTVELDVHWASRERAKARRSKGKVVADSTAHGD